MKIGYIINAALLVAFSMGVFLYGHFTNSWDNGWGALALIFIYILGYSAFVFMNLIISSAFYLSGNKIKGKMMFINSGISLLSGVAVIGSIFLIDML